MRSLRAWCLWYDARTRSRPCYRVGARCDYRAIRQMRQGCHHHRLSLRAAVHGYVSGWPGPASPRRGGSPPQRRGAVSPTPAAIGAGARCSRRGRNSVGLSHFLANRRRGFILAFRQRAGHPHHLLRRVVPPGLLDDRPLLRGIVEALEIFLQLDRVHLRHRITFLHRGTTHQERHHPAGTHPGISQHTNRRTRRAPMAGHAACSDGGAARRCRAGGPNCAGARGTTRRESRPASYPVSYCWPRRRGYPRREVALQKPGHHAAARPWSALPPHRAGVLPSYATALSNFIPQSR